MRWEPPVLHEFHELWAVSSDPAAVRAARENAERLLGADPSQAGRHLSEGFWRIDVPPLIHHYSIDPARQVVEITDVQDTPGPTP